MCKFCKPGEEGAKQKGTKHENLKGTLQLMITCGSRVLNIVACAIAASLERTVPIKRMRGKSIRFVKVTDYLWIKGKEHVS